jgi:hypothetical protein
VVLAEACRNRLEGIRNLLAKVNSRVKDRVSRPISKVKDRVC